MSAVNFFTQTMTHSAKSATDKFGKPSFAAGSSVPCKFVDKLTKLKNARGEEISSDSKAYVARTLSINNEDKCTFNSIDYEVIAVETQTGTVTTLDHKVVYLKRTAE